MVGFLKRLFGKKDKGHPEDAETEGEGSGNEGTGTVQTPIFEKQEPISLELKKPETPGTAAQAPAGKWRCSKCQRIMDDSVMNCSFCGVGKGE